MNKQTIKYFAFVLLIVVLSINACKHEPEELIIPGDGNEDPPETCDTLNITYNATIIPIFEANCIWCHSGTQPDGNLDLTNFDQVAFIAQSGALVGAIEHQPNYSAMPKNGAKLSDCDIAKIKIWIRDTTFVDPPPGGNPCDPDTVYFEKDLLPILQSGCALADCHGTLNPPKDIILVDYASVIASDVIKPGDPEGSDLYEVITETDPDKRMPPPPAQALNADQIKLFRTWIEQGAQNLYCDEMCDTTDVRFTNIVGPIIQNSCFGCHSGSDPGGGILLETYEQVKVIAEDGRLQGVINHEIGFKPMPRNANQLSECKRDQIRIWIENGMPNE